MELTFLRGALPMTKTFTWSNRDERYTTSPYPMLQQVTSFTRDVTSLDEFATALGEAANEGACLLKGSLDRPLNNESRAGHSVERPHEWLVFDFDGVDCGPTFDGAVAALGKYLPKECREVDCIVQMSSSAFRPDTTHLSAHVFMLLDEPKTTKELTEWFTRINFTPPLDSELRLTDSGMSLHFPLDRTVTSPSKLIYIAPPRCVGFKPRLDKHIAINDAAKRALKVPKYIPVFPDVISEKINALRAKNGMAPREWRTRVAHGMEIMIDAEPCVVHDVRTSGSGYIRFNMNGGDSLAYFINVREPALIGNFKGEPYLHTAQAAPELFKALTKAAHSLPPKIPPATIEPLAFYATNRESTVFIGTYDREHDVLRLDPSNNTAALSWMASFGAPKFGNLPHYDLTYDMASEIRFEDGYPVINLYKRTDYIKRFADVAERPVPCEPVSLRAFAEASPTWYRVIRSAVGSDDTAMLYFINWVAAIFQKRDRTTSAWVLHGTQGTGKGLVLWNLLRPLFGETSITQTRFGLLKTDFNGYMRGKLIVAFNEVEMPKSGDWSDIRAKLYDWITEPVIPIHEKGKDIYDEPNFSNIILCANSMRPIVIEDGDRRFNVGVYQDQRLFLQPNEYAAIADGRDLESVAKFLGEWQVNADMLIRPFGAADKARIIDATHSLVDAIARAIREGDVQFFVDNRPDVLQLRTDFNGRVVPINEYNELLKAMADDTLNMLHVADLYVLFRTVALGNKGFPESKAEQRRVYQRYGLLSEQVIRCKRTGKAKRGINAPHWIISKALRAELNELFSADTSNVTPIRRSEA